MPLPTSSYQLLILRLGDDATLEVRKGLLAMASTVLSDALQVDPECTELKVEGTADIWQQLMALALRTREPNLQPSDVEALLPVAHTYNMQGVLELLMGCVQDFKFTMLKADDELYVMKWLSLARKYQVPWMAAACTRFILSLMIVGKCYKTKLGNPDALRAFILKFRPDQAAGIDAPLEIVATLTTAYEALQLHMGL